MEGRTECDKLFRFKTTIIWLTLNKETHEKPTKVEHSATSSAFRPTRAETPQRIVEPRCGPDEFCWCRGIEIRPPKPGGALKRTVLVQDNTRRDQSRPWQKIGEALRVATIFGEAEHEPIS